MSTFLTLVSSLFPGRREPPDVIDALARCKLPSLETQALRLQEEGEEEDSAMVPCDAVTSQQDEEEELEEGWIEILLQVDDTPFRSGSIMPSSFSCCCRISS